MITTSSFIGIKRGELNYLFFLVTEPYIEENQTISKNLSPLLTEFARELGDKAALVRPFSGDEKTSLGDVLKKGWHDSDLRGVLPALLVTNEDFEAFNREKDNHLLISLRDLIDDSGNVNVFAVRALLRELAYGAIHEDLFYIAKQFIAEQKIKRAKKEAREAVEIELGLPGVIGIKIQAMKAIEFLKSIREANKLRN